MVTQKIKSRHHLNKEEVNRRLAEGWLQILREKGPEPEPNMLRLSRVSGVPYRTLKRRVAAGFYQQSLEAIVEEFRTATKRYISSPEIMALQIVKLVDKHRVWLAIEVEQHSILLWERLQKELHDLITANWSFSVGEYQEALYALFWFRLWKAARNWQLANYDAATKRHLETYVKMLLEACEGGRFVVSEVFD